MKTMIIENWKTSLLGLALIAAGLYTGITAKQNWFESGPIILSGVGLLFAKDAQNSPETILKQAFENQHAHE